MPIQEYLCLECDTHYEALIRTGNSELESTCPECGSTRKEYCPSAFSTKLSAIHASERPVILRNAKGEVRFPMDANAPIHEKYVAQGFKKEYAFETFAQRNEFEKSTGKIHERSHYDTGSGNAERDLTQAPSEADNLAKVKHKLRSLRTL